jgi:ornithine--oxo-acid transaminase
MTAVAMQRHAQLIGVAHGVLTCDTHGTVIRFAPPLVVTRDELDWAIERIRVCFGELDRGIRRAA